MKKFTKKLTKAVLTLAAVLAFNAYAGDTVPYGGDSGAPTSATKSYDAVGALPAIYWAPGSNVENNSSIFGNYTGVQINNVLGKYYNNPDNTISGNFEFGLYTKSNTDMSLLTIENWGGITNNYITALKMVGINGQLNNWYDSYVSGNSIGVQIDTETGNSLLLNGFTIHNEGNISSNGVGIYVSNANQAVTINNYYTGIISGKNNAILANNPITITNENTILSQDKAAIYLTQGGTITNNGMIMSLATTLDAGRSVRSEGNLTLKGTGSYQGDIEFTGNSQALSILSLQSEGIQFKNSRLTNWSYIMVDGGKHYFNVVNDAQNSNYPRTEIVAHSNAYINTGAGGWGDANITLSGNSLLNPYRNDYDAGIIPNFYWDRPALKLDTNPAVVIYDRKEFEKLTVNNLTIEAGSGLVMEVRYSEPNYTPSDSINDEDDRVGYWDDMHEGVESIYNPDGSYAGQGYRTRLKKVSGEVGDLFLYQRVSYDTIDVKGTATIETGAKLHLLEKTKWIEDDGYTPEFVEKPLANLEINLFDGNISLDQFDWNIDYYSDYYGIESVDKVNGIIHLSRDAYHNVFSGTKGQIDWWLKQASLGFPSSNPAATAQTTSLAPMERALQVEKNEARSASQTTSTEQEDAAAAAQAAFDAANNLVTVTDNGNVGTQAQATSNDDNDETSAPKPVKSEVLPYQVAKHYSVKITDLDKSIDLRDVIYSFNDWNDVDAFMDTLNKLEYASLATSNINAINSRVSNIYNHMGKEYRHENGIALWSDFYYANNSLDGKGDHHINSSSSEMTFGIDKMVHDKFILGLSGTYLNYNSSINDSGVHTDIDSEGFGLNVYGTYKAGAWTHKAIVGYAGLDNKTNDDLADFGSSELFAAYRAEYLIERPGFDVTWIAGLRFANVKYDEIREDAENGLEGFDHNSLESELGVKLSKQFKKLRLNVSAAWMHEMMDTQTTATAYTSFGSFEQDGIERSADRLRLSIGTQYQITDKVTFDFDLGKDLSSNSESHSVNGKLTFRF